MRCPICKGFAEDGVPLSDGRILHEECLKRKQLELQEISSWFKESCAEIKKYQYYSDNRNNPIFWLLRPVLVQKPEFKDCNKFLEIKKRDSLILKDMLNSFSQELTSLYDLFLEYPPDWENRRSQVIARDRICQQC